MRSKILKIYAGILGIGIIYLIWVLATGIYIPCVYYASSGLLCPGCGVSRMFVALVHLEIAKAFSYNPVVFMMIAAWNLIALLCFAGKPRYVQTNKFLYAALGITIAVLVVWGGVRNIH